MIKQELKVIVTNPEENLESKLQAIIEEGYWIYWIVQDVVSKGGYEAMYIVGVGKQKEFKPYPKPFKPKKPFEKKFHYQKNNNNGNAGSKQKQSKPNNNETAGTSE